MLLVLIAYLLLKSLKSQITSHALSSYFSNTCGLVFRGYFVNGWIMAPFPQDGRSWEGVELVSTDAAGIQVNNSLFLVSRHQGLLIFYLHPGQHGRFFRHTVILLISEC